MNRRHFIQSIAAGIPALTIGGSLFAAPAGSPRFLLVFLRGGYDCASLLVPYSSDFYYASRSTLAVPRPAKGDAKSALRLDAEWALSPVVRDSIGPLYARGQAAFVPFCGTDDLSRSHFETQDSIELGQPIGGSRDLDSGFLARLSSRLRKAPPIAFTDALPLVFQGGTDDIPNIALRRLPRAVFDERESSTLAAMYRDTSLEPAVSDGLALRRNVASELADPSNNASRGAVTANGFALEAERIATLMRGDYRLAFVDVGGWDTHVAEGAMSGTLARNLDNLGNGLAAFARTLGNEWNNTVVVVVSEFGRTFRENGNQGTDHGHGSVYWVLGGGIHGGRVVGEQVAVARGNLLQDRDYPVLNDYRDVLGGVFRRLWGLSASDLDEVFPSAHPRDLGLV
jgi:uncharacterized protein (DUF1501 family)